MARVRKVTGRKRKQTNSRGINIKDVTQLAKRTRTSSGVWAAFNLVGSQYSGADPLGRMMMFAPNPFQSGSSVSHFDTSAFRNQLMEPAISGDLTHSVLPPQDLSYRHVWAIVPIFYFLGIVIARKRYS